MWDVLIRCVTETSAYLLPNTMSEIHRQGDLAPFPSKMLYLIKPHFFFLKTRETATGKEGKATKSTEIYHKMEWADFNKYWGKNKTL